MPSIGRFRYLEATPPPGVRHRGTLLLLHAFPLNARMWEPQLSLAEAGWRIVAPQFRGFDGGAADPKAATVDDYAGDVIDLLDSLHIQEVVLGGLSMGGYAAFALLRLAPNYIRALVLADTRSTADTPEGIAGRQRMLKTLAEQGVTAVAEEMIPKLLGETTRNTQPAIVERVRALAVANSPEAVEGAIHVLMSRPDSTPLLSSIHVPTLVIVGTEDTLTPPSAAEDMHRRIAGSVLITIPAAGHLANLEQPIPFSSALNEFLTHRV